MARVKHTMKKSVSSANKPKRKVAKKPVANKPAKKSAKVVKPKEKSVRRSRVKYTLDNTDLHHAIALEKRLTTAPKRERKPKAPSTVDYDIAKRIIACKSFKDFVNYSFKNQIGDVKPSVAPSQIISRLVKQGIAVEKN